MSDDQIDDSLPETPEEPTPSSPEDSVPEGTNDAPTSETSSDVSEGEDAQDLYQPDQPRQDFQEDYPTSTPLPEEERHLNNDPVVLREALATFERVMERFAPVVENMEKRQTALFERLRNKDQAPTADDMNQWLWGVLNAASVVDADTDAPTANREGAQWRQYYEHEGKTIRPGIPKINAKSGFQSEHASLLLARKAGMGVAWDQPLYGSGIWLRFKTPTLASLVQLQHTLGELKVTVGASTKGLAFTGLIQKQLTAVVDFALQHVIAANVHYSTPADLKEYIYLNDAPDILLGIAVTMFPNGFKYAHTCVADPENCNHVTRETLNLKYLHWLDDLALTERQKTHMGKRLSVKYNAEDLVAYRDEHRLQQRKLVWVDEDNGIGMGFRVPTLQEYAEVGDQWVDDLIRLTSGAFNEPPGGNNRNSYITELSNATAARQWRHWIECLYVAPEDPDDEPEAITDDEVINETLHHLFSDDTLYEKLEKAVRDFSAGAQVAMVAIHSFNCPVCNSPQATEFHKRFPHLIKLDALSLFFTVVNQKLK